MRGSSRGYERGARWTTKTRGNFRFPRDGRFSGAVKALGYFVAWNDAYVVRNLGHNIEEFKSRLPYYIENYTAKPRKGVEHFDRLLRAHGHRLVRDEAGRWSIEEQGDVPETPKEEGLPAPEDRRTKSPRPWWRFW